MKFMSIIATIAFLSVNSAGLASFSRNAEAQSKLQGAKSMQIPVNASHLQFDSKPDAHTKVEKSFPVASVSRIRAGIEIGSIHFIPTSGDSLQIRAIRKVKGGSERERKRWLEETRVDIASTNGELVVRDFVPKSLSDKRLEKSNFRHWLELNIQGSARQSLNATVDAGEIEVTDMAGELMLKAGIGNVMMHNLKASGKNVTAHSDVGNIFCEGRVGELNLSCETGKIQLKEVKCDGLCAKLRSDLGEILAIFRKLPSASIIAEAQTGEVKIKLPSNAGFKLDIATQLGTVKSPWRGSLQQKIRRDKGENFLGESLKLQVKSGGPLVKAQTSLGAITLEQN